VPSLGRRRHRVVNATCSYFANKQQLHSMKHEAVVSTTISTTGRWTIASCIHPIMLRQCCKSVIKVLLPASPLPRHRCVSAALNWMTARIRTYTLYIDDSNEYGRMKGRTVVCRISVICEWRLAHFSPISQDENFSTRIVSLKSRDIVQ